MNNNRWQQVESLFHSALELGAEGRTAFLDESCDGDPELRHDVDALLSAFELSDEFMEATPLAGVLTSVVEQNFEAGERNGSPGELPSGKRIFHYEIQSLIGAGGMGEVYLARDEVLGRPVAIKVLPEQVTQDEEHVRRFEREAQAASALNHPNIITVYEVGHEQETRFIAMEFIAGQTLRQKIKDGGVSIKEALRIASQITEALVAAHDAGVVHRDIKPENVMVRPDGLVKVLDFGLAKPLSIKDDCASLSGIPLTMRTDPGTFMGTISYLSPEQVRLEDADHRTDIFSLGVVLFELIAGERPFKGNNAASVCEAIRGHQPDVESLQVPDIVRRILTRALEKDRQARYQDAAELRSDLERAAAEVKADPRRPRTLVWVAAAIVVALIVVVVIQAVTRSRNPKPLHAFITGRTRRITDMPGQEIFPTISPDGSMIAYSSMALGSWDIYLKKVGEAGVVNLTPERRYVDLSPAFSPDGKTIAFRSSRDGEGIFLMDTAGRNITRVSREGHNPSWSPDGNEIAVATDRVFDFEGRNDSFSSLFAINVKTGERRSIAATDAVQPSWSPHGHRIAYWGIHNGGQRDIWTVSAVGGDPIQVTNDAAVDWNPVWSRDGSYLYFLSSRAGSMNLWRAPINELTGGLTGPIEPATLPSANSQHIGFSADGRSLVYVEMSRRENTCRVQLDPEEGRIEGQAVQITRGIRRHCAPNISPDENRLAFSSQGEAQEDIFTVGVDGSQALQLTNDLAIDRLPRWSPDGQLIAFTSDRSGKLEMWIVRSDGEGLEQLTRGSGADVTNPVWSPDGGRLLYQVVGVNSFTVDPAKPREERLPQPLAGKQVPWFLPWSWSPDGKLLAGWQLRPEPPDMNLVVYSFVDGAYKSFPIRGQYPVWMKDNRRLVFSTLSEIFILDTRTQQVSLLHSIAPDHVGTIFLSRDNGRLYYSRISTEADIWLISLN